MTFISISDRLCSRNLPPSGQANLNLPVKIDAPYLLSSGVFFIISRAAAGDVSW
jgi:hypothetical protein